MGSECIDAESIPRNTTRFNHHVARRHTIKYPHATETTGTMTDTAR